MFSNKKVWKLIVDWVISCVVDKVDISEMDILVLEEFVRDKLLVIIGDDLLERLVLFVFCFEECLYCCIESVEVYD